MIHDGAAKRMAKIHPTALIEDGAVLGAASRSDPFCHVGAQVHAGRRRAVSSPMSRSRAYQIGARTKSIPARRWAAKGRFAAMISPKAGWNRRRLRAARNGSA